MKKLYLAILLMLLCFSHAAAEELSERAPSCRVWVNGQEVQTVYQTAVCTQRSWEENPPLSSVPVAIAVTNAPYQLEISFLDADVQSAAVRPLALGIEAEIREGRVCFTVNEPANLTVEFNGQIEGALHLFLDSPDEKPDPDAPRVRYFGPGIYKDQIITVKATKRSIWMKAA